MIDSAVLRRGGMSTSRWRCETKTCVQNTLGIWLRGVDKTPYIDAEDVFEQVHVNVGAAVQLADS